MGTIKGTGSAFFCETRTLDVPNEEGLNNHLFQFHKEQTKRYFCVKCDFLTEKRISFHEHMILEINTL